MLDKSIISMDIFGFVRQKQPGIFAICTLSDKFVRQIRPTNLYKVRIVTAQLRFVICPTNPYVQILRSHEEPNICYL